MSEHLITQEDIARTAGVHRSTVSLALRGSSLVSETRRKEILQIAEQLGYRANPLVSALMRNRRQKKADQSVPIAFVTNFPTRYGWRPTHHPRPDYFPAAERRAQELGFKLEHFWLAEPGMTPRRFCDILLNRGIHGMIIGRLPSGQHSLELDYDKFSCLSLGLTLTRPALHHITENHFNAALQAMHRCRQYGYRRVAYVTTDVDDSPRVGRRWRGAILSYALDFDPRDRLLPCPQRPPDFGQFAAWLEEQQPDVLMVSNAEPALAWLERLGRRVPQDIALVELGSNPHHLDCARVEYAPDQIGKLAVEMLVGMMHRNEKGIPADPHEVVLPGRWRDSWTLPNKTGWAETSFSEDHSGYTMPRR